MMDQRLDVEKARYQRGSTTHGICYTRTSYSPVISNKMTVKLLMFLIKRRVGSTYYRHISDKETLWNLMINVNHSVIMKSSDRLTKPAADTQTL